MIAVDRQRYTLQTIFSFFLGLMVLAFIGVGVNTFYPSPADKFVKQRQETARRQETLKRSAAPGNFTAAERAQLDSLSVEQDKLNDRVQAEEKDWARVTSIILVLFSTLVLVVSLVLSDQIRVISNGLLLGGLFTMVYGVGWVIFSGNSVARFWVIFLALVVAIGLGYVKFVRGRRQKGAVPVTSDGATDGAALDMLASRVTALEERASAAAAALAGNGVEQKS